MQHACLTMQHVLYISARQCLKTGQLFLVRICSMLPLMVSQPHVLSPRMVNHVNLLACCRHACLLIVQVLALQDASVVNRSISSASAMNMGQQAPPSPPLAGAQMAPPSLGQQYFTHIEVPKPTSACVSDGFCSVPALSPHVHKPSILARLCSNP